MKGIPSKYTYQVCAIRWEKTKYLTIFCNSTRSSAKKSDGSARYLRNPRRRARRTEIFWAWMKLSKIVACKQKSWKKKLTKKWRFFFVKNKKEKKLTFFFWENHVRSACCKILRSIQEGTPTHHPLRRTGLRGSAHDVSSISWRTRGVPYDEIREEPSPRWERTHGVIVCLQVCGERVWYSPAETWEKTVTQSSYHTARETPSQIWLWQGETPHLSLCRK